MKISLHQLTGFTLIELMVAITIMSILMFASYIPYEYHQKKMALNQAAREISQSLSEARNLAIHGLDTGSGNLTIALVFQSGAKVIDYYAYPYIETPQLLSLNPAYKIKSKNLPGGVEIKSINNNPDTSFLFSFIAISGSGNIIDNVIPIVVSYNGSEDPILQKEIRYYPKSYMSDYH